MSATKTTGLSAALVALVLIIGLSTVTVALLEVRKAGAEKATLAETMSRFQSDQERLRLAERAATAAADQLAGLQAEAKAQAEAARKAGAAAQRPGPGRAGGQRKQKEDGQAFLAAFGQSKAMLMEIGKLQIERNSALFFKQMGMTPAQIEDFETQTAQHWLDTILTTPVSVHPGEGDLPDDQLQALLGDSGLQAYKDFERARPAQGWATSVAKTVAEEGAPLSVEQISALAQAVTNNSPDYSAGGPIKPAAVNWTNVLAQAKQTMSEAQWQAAQSAILMQQVTLQAQTISQQGGKGP